MLTEICLCHACSDHAIEDGHARAGKIPDYDCTVHTAKTQVGTRAGAGGDHGIAHI
jgi:hypothetical protein